MRRLEKGQGQPRKGTRAGKKRHKGGQVKAQGHPRKGTSDGQCQQTFFPHYMNIFQHFPTFSNIVQHFITFP